MKTYGNPEWVCELAADWKQGTLRFQVKWEGYEKKADMTWEPEENLV